MSEKKHMMGVHLPVSLHMRLKKAAAEQRRTMTAIIREAIEVAVELHEERAETAA